MTEIKSNGVPQEIKCNELPQETTLTNTLKLIGNSDNQIRQIGVDLLRDYVNNTLQGQIDIIQDYIGNLNDLSTTQKDSLVNAVKEVDNKIDVLNTGISTVQSDITELNSALLNKQSYPDYSKISTIISGGVGTKTYTCTENGFVQFVGTSGNNSVKPEIDLSINGVYVFKYRTGYQTDYVKATSGLFPVKQGDVIKCVIQSSFVNESVRFYQLRY